MKSSTIFFFYIYTYIKYDKCIAANTSAIWQQAVHTTYQLSSPSCSTRAIQKTENGPLGEKMTRQKEQEDYIGTKTREEIGKGNQVQALRLQKGN